MKTGLTMIDSDRYLDLRDLVQATRVPTDPDRWELVFCRGSWIATAVVSGKFKDDLLRRLDESAMTGPIPLSVAVIPSPSS